MQVTECESLRTRKSEVEELEKMVPSQKEREDSPFLCLSVLFKPSRVLRMPAHISEGGSSLFSPLIIQGFPGGSDGKESAWNAGDLGSVPALGKCPGGGQGNPL